MESFKGAGTIYAYMNTLKGASIFKISIFRSNIQWVCE